MIPEIPLPPESQTRALLGNPGWTPAHEVKYLCWLAQQCAGDILEIGCNNGQTTRELATAAPQKLIYGVDWTGAPTMCPEQRGEQPPKLQLGALAQACPNVELFDQRSVDWPYQDYDLGLVFIDGDHSRAGVEADTRCAIDYFRGRPLLTRPRWIVWHDCYPESPRWCGVYDFLDELGVYGASWAPPLPVRRITGTWLALLNVEAIAPAFRIY